MSLYQRLLGHPFVYDRIRPLAVGGIDMSPLFRMLEAQPGDVVLDVGCGTGIALDHLPPSVRYFGFDVDPVAVNRARERFGAREGVHLEVRQVTAADVAELRPNRIILSGLLHHLDDATAAALLEMCAQSDSVRRVATSDVVYLPGKHLSNLLASLDRGKHVRAEEDYPALANRAGLRVVDRRIVRCHPTRGLALYLMMALDRGEGR
jgi:SAM-dependent methyltransferase